MILNSSMASGSRGTSLIAFSWFSGSNGDGSSPDEFEIIFSELGVQVSLAKSLFQNIDAILRRARRQHEGRAGDAKAALQGEHPAFFVVLGEGLDLGQLGESRMGMLFAFGAFP